MREEPVGLVFVVGSINQDFVLVVRRRPEPGETVTDAELVLWPGGKGANQAVAAARLGARVGMLGRVGDDAFGEALVKNLEENGVETALVEAVEGSSTGAAFITVTPDGENAIVVASGANRGFGGREVEEAWGEVGAASVLLVQMEVRLEAVARAAELAEAGGGRVLLNLAPPVEAPPELLGVLDPLIVNEHEAAFLLGERVEDIEGARRCVVRLLELGPRSVVITLGALGAVGCEKGEVFHCPAPEVEVVDTTGAGDAFCGALATRLAARDSLENAVGYAVRAGAAAVTRHGAQGAMPTPQILEDTLNPGSSR